MPDPAPAVIDAADVASPHGLRRRLVGAGLVGLAGSLLPGLATRAGAAPDEAPVRQPTEDDLVLLRFAQQAELAAVSLYTTALSTELGPVTEAVLGRVRDAHLAYSQALGAEIGRTAPGSPAADLVTELEPAFAGPQSGMISTALGLENTLVATHTQLIGTLRSSNAAKLIASVVIAESRHAVVLADLSGVTEVDAYVVNDATPLEPAEG